MKSFLSLRMALCLAPLCLQAASPKASKKNQLLYYTQKKKSSSKIGGFKTLAIGLGVTFLVGIVIAYAKFGRKQADEAIDIAQADDGQEADEAANIAQADEVQEDVEVSPLVFHSLSEEELIRAQEEEENRQVNESLQLLQDENGNYVFSTSTEAYIATCNEIADTNRVTEYLRKKQERLQGILVTLIQGGAAPCLVTTSKYRGGEAKLSFLYLMEGFREEKEGRWIKTYDLDRHIVNAILAAGQRDAYLTQIDHQRKTFFERIMAENRADSLAWLLAKMQTLDLPQKETYLRDPFMGEPNVLAYALFYAKAEIFKVLMTHRAPFPPLAENETPYPYFWKAIKEDDAPFFKTVVQKTYVPLLKAFDEDFFRRASSDGVTPILQLAYKYGTRYSPLDFLSNYLHKKEKNAAFEDLLEDINKKSPNDAKTPLLVALHKNKQADKNSLGGVLIQLGADYADITMDGKRILPYAIENNLKFVVKTLMEVNNDPLAFMAAQGVSQETLVAYVCTYGVGKIYDLFKKAGTPLAAIQPDASFRDEAGNTLLHLVVKDTPGTLNLGKADILKDLLQKEAFKQIARLPNDKGETPLHLARQKDVKRLDKISARRNLVRIKEMIQLLETFEPS